MSEHEGDPYDWDHHYELIEHAFTLWRAGEKAMQGTPWLLPSVLAGHERAVSVGVELLRRYSSISELVAAYYSPKLVDVDEDGDSMPWGRESWVEYACRVASAPQASRAIVEDASYFRRSRELILQATEGA
jgi:hypothetical protein